MFINCQNWAATRYEELGMPKEKLVIDIPTYGRSFTLTTNDTGLRAPAGPSTFAGPYSNETGYLTYYEVGA